MALPKQAAAIMRVIDDEFALRMWLTERDADEAWLMGHTGMAPEPTWGYRMSTLRLHRTDAGFVFTCDDTENAGTNAAIARANKLVAAICEATE
jgi:hypothetical protein